MNPLMKFASIFFVSLSLPLLGCNNYSKLTTVAADNWAVGEYKSCMSVRAKAEGDFLDCTGADDRLSKSEKKFMVRFEGNPHYTFGLDTSEEEQPDNSLYIWSCRKTDDSEVPFICDFQSENRREAQTGTPTQNSPEPPYTESRQLGSKEVEYYRKRNECEARFMDNGIYAIDGKAVGAICRDNPNRRP